MLPGKKDRTKRLRLESLESRQMMSVSDPVKGVVTITSTAGNDTITISQTAPKSITVVENGVTTTRTGVKSIVINPGLGLDTVTIGDGVTPIVLKKDITINGVTGDGANAYTINNLTAKKLSISGGDVVDTIVIGNLAEVNLKKLEINGGAGADPITVNNLNVKHAVIRGGSEVDVINVGNVSAVRAKRVLGIDGGTAGDTINADRVVTRKLVINDPIPPNNQDTVTIPGNATLTGTKFKNRVNKHTEYNVTGTNLTAKKSVTPTGIVAANDPTNNFDKWVKS